jgi:hypothetical protein
MWGKLQANLGEVPTHVRDDRGAVHAVREGGYPSPGAMPAPPARGDPRARQIRAYLRMRRQAASPLYHLVLGSAIVPLALCAFVASTLMLRAGRPLYAVTALFFGGVCLFVALRNPTWMRRRAALMHHNLFGAAGRCLVCGYDISACKRDPDGYTVCPECGAAWRVSSPTPNPPGTR